MMGIHGSELKATVHAVTCTFSLNYMMMDVFFVSPWSSVGNFMASLRLVIVAVVLH